MIHLKLKPYRPLGSMLAKMWCIINLLENPLFAPTHFVTKVDEMGSSPGFYVDDEERKVGIGFISVQISFFFPRKKCFIVDRIEEIIN